MKSLPSIIFAAAFYAVALAAPGAKANPITGSIGFGGTGVAVNGPTLASSTDFSVDDPFTTSMSGTYSAVPLMTELAFNGFVFTGTGAVSAVTPLWKFVIGSTTYEFSATSLSSYYDSITRQWDMGGNGIASVTGYSDTLGEWDVNLSQSGESFVFDASTAPNAPAVQDGGSTLALLGSALIGLTMFGRKVGF